MTDYPLMILSRKLKSTSLEAQTQDRFSSSISHQVRKFFINQFQQIFPLFIICLKVFSSIFYLVSFFSFCRVRRFLIKQSISFSPIGLGDFLSTLKASFSSLLSFYKKEIFLTACHLSNYFLTSVITTFEILFPLTIHLMELAFKKKSNCNVMTHDQFTELQFS